MQIQADASVPRRVPKQPELCVKLTFTESPFNDTF